MDRGIKKEEWDTEPDLYSIPSSSNEQSQSETKSDIDSPLSAVPLDDEAERMGLTRSGDPWLSAENHWWAFCRMMRNKSSIEPPEDRYFWPSERDFTEITVPAAMQCRLHTSAHWQANEGRMTYLRDSAEILFDDLGDPFLPGITDPLKFTLQHGQKTDLEGHWPMTYYDDDDPRLVFDCSREAVYTFPQSWNASFRGRARPLIRLWKADMRSRRYIKSVEFRPRAWLQSHGRHNAVIHRVNWAIDHQRASYGTLTISFHSLPIRGNEGVIRGERQVHGAESASMRTTAIASGYID